MRVTSLADYLLQPILWAVLAGTAALLALGVLVMVFT